MRNQTTINHNPLSQVEVFSTQWKSCLLKFSRGFYSTHSKEMTDISNTSFNYNLLISRSSQPFRKQS